MGNHKGIAPKGLTLHEEDVSKRKINLGLQVLFGYETQGLCSFSKVFFYNFLFFAQNQNLSQDIV